MLYLKVIKIHQDFPRVMITNVMPPFNGSQCMYTIYVSSCFNFFYYFKKLCCHV